MRELDFIVGAAVGGLMGPVVIATVTHVHHRWKVRRVLKAGELVKAKQRILFRSTRGESWSQRLKRRS